MAYYNRFGGDYEKSMRDIRSRYTDLHWRVRDFTPADFADLIEADEDREPYHELSWVRVRDPRNNGAEIEVKPVLHLGEGDEEDGIAAGAQSFHIDGRLDSGEELLIGLMQTFSMPDGRPKYDEPLVMVNMKGQDMIISGSIVRWDSADAELFLRLAESAFAAQTE